MIHLSSRSRSLSSSSKLSLSSSTSISLRYIYHFSLNIQHLFDSFSRIKWLEWIYGYKSVVFWLNGYFIICLVAQKNEGNEKERKKIYNSLATNLQTSEIKFHLYVIHVYGAVLAHQLIYLTVLNFFELYKPFMPKARNCLMKCLKEILYHGIWWLQVIYLFLEHLETLTIYMCVWAIWNIKEDDWCP